MHGSSLCMCFWRKTGSGRLEVVASDVSGRWNLLNQSQLKAGAISPGTPALSLPPSLIALRSLQIIDKYYKLFRKDAWKQPSHVFLKKDWCLED